MSKNKKFRFVNYDRPGKGVTKQEAQKQEENRYSIGGFFRIFGRNISLLAMLNLVFVFTNLFLFAALLAMTGNYDTYHLVPASSTFQTLYGVSALDTSGALSALQGIGSVLNSVGYASTTTYVLYGVAGLTLFTFGPTSAGLAYVLRGLSRGDYVDLGDYFRAIRKNFFQALLLGVLDVLVLCVFGYAVYFYFLQTAGGFGYQMMYFLSLFFFLIYLMMRSFLYLLIVTFKLSLWKAVKNSYILTVAGIRRNVTALVGAGLVLVLNVVLFIVVAPIGAILPFILTISLISFMSIFAAYPTVKRLMIDPYYPAESVGADEEEEPVFRDMG